MKINKNSNRKKYLVSGVVAATLIIGALVFMLVRPNSDESKTSTPAKQEAAAGTAKKLETIDQKNTGDEKTVSSNSAKNQDETNTPTSTTPTMRITAANQNGSLYQLRVLIDIVEAGGSCTLTLTQGSDVVTREVATQSLAQSTTCQGFDIPLKELEQGTWNVQIVYKINDMRAEVRDVIEVNI